MPPSVQFPHASGARPPETTTHTSRGSHDAKTEPVHRRARRHRRPHRRRELRAKKRARSEAGRAVKTRVSQINGCAYCLHMHTQEARKFGETDTRLHLLDAGHESGLYSKRERAAFVWAEALTN